MKTNDLKKSDRVKLRCGWEGTMMDNRKGNTREVDVEGDYREIGSVYAHDITHVQVDTSTGLEWLKLEHTNAQLDLMKLVNWR